MTNTHNGTFRICKEVTISYRDFISTILSDGIYYFSAYGFYIDWDKEKYREARSRLAKQKLDQTLECIYAEMIIAGGDIKFVLKEGFDVQITPLTLDVVEKALWKFLEEEPSDAFQLAFDRVYHEESDAEDCDVLLQYILFGEYIFS